MVIRGPAPRRPAETSPGSWATSAAWGHRRKQHHRHDAPTNNPVSRGTPLRGLPCAGRRRPGVHAGRPDSWRHRPHARAVRGGDASTRPDTHTCSRSDSCTVRVPHALARSVVRTGSLRVAVAGSDTNADARSVALAGSLAICRPFALTRAVAEPFSRARSGDHRPDLGRAVGRAPPD